MPPREQIIHIHPEAPPKPAEGQPCNGCGVCCLAEPCPVGVLVSRRRTGACVALQWSDAGRRYVCGLMGETDVAMGAPQPAWPRRLWRRWVRRVIASGIGCDAGLEVSGPGGCQARGEQIVLKCTVGGALFGALPAGRLPRMTALISGADSCARSCCSTPCSPPSRPGP